MNMLQTNFKEALIDIINYFHRAIIELYFYRYHGSLLIKIHTIISRPT